MGVGGSLEGFRGALGEGLEGGFGGIDEIN